MQMLGSAALIDAIQRYDWIAPTRFDNVIGRAMHARTTTFFIEGTAMALRLDDDAPDRKFWTAYDHFMIEREARAMRREYAYGLLRSWWRRLTALRPRIVSAASSGARQVQPRA